MADNTSPSEKLNIQLRIGNDIHPITIRRELEATFRQAAKNINDKLGRYREAYPGLSQEKCISMTLLDFAVYALQAANDTSTQPYDEAIRQLTFDVEEALGLVDVEGKGTPTNNRPSTP